MPDANESDPQSKFRGDALAIKPEAQPRVKKSLEVLEPPLGYSCAPVFTDPRKDQRDKESTGGSRSRSFLGGGGTFWQRDPSQGNTKTKNFTGLGQYFFRRDLNSHSKKCPTFYAPRGHQNHRKFDQS